MSCKEVQTYGWAAVDDRADRGTVGLAIGRDAEECTKRRHGVGLCNRDDGAAYKRDKSGVRDEVSECMSGEPGEQTHLCFTRFRMGTCGSSRRGE